MPKAAWGTGGRPVREPRPLSTAALARRLELSEPEILALLDRCAQALAPPAAASSSGKPAAAGSSLPKPEHEDVVRAARIERGELPLTAAARETLAAILLHQPVTTQDVNRARGCDSTASFRTLERRGFIARSPTEPPGFGAPSVSCSKPAGPEA